MEYFVIAMIALMGMYVSKTAILAKREMCNSVGDYYLVKLYGYTMAILTFTTVIFWLTLG